VSPERDEKRFEALLPQLVDGDIPAQAGVEADLNPELSDHGHFPVDHFPWQPIAWNTYHHHPAGHRQGFDNGHPIAFQGKEIGGRQTRRTRPDEAHPAAIGGRFGRVSIGSFRHRPFRRKALQVFDRNRFVNAAPDAHQLAGIGADQSANPGEGIVPANQLDGFCIPPHPDQGHVTGDIDPRRAGGLTGSGSQSGALSCGADGGFDMAEKDFAVVIEHLQHLLTGLPADLIGAGIDDFLGESAHGRVVFGATAPPGNILQQSQQNFRSLSATRHLQSAVSDRISQVVDSAGNFTDRDRHKQSPLKPC